MNILITGCNGQLGKELQRLQSEYQQYHFYNTDVDNLDITDQVAIEQFIANNSIDGIVNCAAFTAVDKAESEQQLCQLLNSEAPAFLANAIEKRNGWIIQISTDYVFDGNNCQPYRESDETSPLGIYGKTKLVGELNVLKLCSRSIVIRTAWLYSEFGNNFVKTIMRVAKERESINVVFDQIGSPTYAADLAETIMHIIKVGITPGTYHYSNEGIASWYDFSRKILQLSGIGKCQVSPILTEDYPTPATRPHYSVLNKNKVKQTYGIEIPHWEDSLKKCLSRLNKTNE